MKRLFMLAVAVLLLNGCNTEDVIQSGDIIFHTSKSDQSEAMRIVTGSKYTHVGVIMQDKDGYYNVFEISDKVNTNKAIASGTATRGAVKKNPLKNFINRGDDSKFTVMRVRIFTPRQKKPLKEAIKKFMNTPQDYHFQWNDDELYSSEFVYKIFLEAVDVKLGEFKNFGEYDLSSEEAKAYLDIRFPDGFNENEPILSPDALSKSPNLRLIYSSYE